MLGQKQSGVKVQPYKHENDPEHVGKQMYCCCSIAHKHGNGCVDHGFVRQQEPWEVTDGCIFLLRELSQVQGEGKEQAVQIVESYLQYMPEIVSLDHFRHSIHLKENAFKSMTEMIKPTNLGKRKFRPFVDALVEPAFINAAAENKNCSLSAQEFLIALGKTLGERIF